MSGRLCVILNSWQASNIYKSDSDTSFRVCLFQITSCFVFFLKIKKKKTETPKPLFARNLQQPDAASGRQGCVLLDL